MKDFILKLFTRKPDRFLGVLGEQNTTNVYDFSEIVAKSSQASWVEKDIKRWRTFTQQYQSSSSACVAFTIAKMAQILYYLKSGRRIKFSPGWIYKQRTPKVEGMWIDNAIAIAGGGLPTEELYPSEGLNEQQINSLPDLPYTGGVAKEFAISVNWVNLPISFETIASSIQNTQKGIMLWFEFGEGEWFNRSIPIIKGSRKPYKHSVTAVDAIVYKDKKYIVIEDSADIDTEFEHRKLISEEFFSRCILARYPLNFKFDTTIVKPRYDGGVKSLQDCLKFEGLFPSNVDSTGFMGNITIQAIKDFQKRYNILQTGTVGPITSEKIKELYP